MRLFLGFFLFLYATLALGRPVTPADVDRCLVELAGPSSDGTLKKIFSSRSDAAGLRAAILRVGATDVGRRRLAEWAKADLKAREASILAPSNLAKKKIVFVGGGIHTVIAVANLVGRNPELAKSVLILEGGDTISTNFGSQSPFRINSGKPPGIVPTEATPNLFPGALVSPEDFGYDQAGDHFPSPSILGDTAAIALRAENVDVLFGHSVSRFLRGGNGTARGVRCTNGRFFPADVVVFALGMSVPKIRGIYGLAGALAAERGKAVPRVELYTDYLRRLARTRLAGFDVYRDADIGILGGEHGANTVAETFLGKLVVEGLTFPLLPVRKIHWWGQSAQTGHVFLSQQAPGGATGARELFRERYSRYGLPEAFDDNVIDSISSHADRVEIVDDKVVVGWNGHRRAVDRLFVATGLETPALGILDASLADYDLVPMSGEEGWLATQVFVQDEDFGEGLSAYLIGPGSRLPIEPDRLARTTTGSPHSVNYQGPVSARFGRWLRARLTK